mmetsp:Transcript_13796/g.18009  ORF Transcript_13796/g.18009 Transcript_13796/m.18009 type:complete len:335 (-) Transcript_13796:1276-2280(-)|eukprot:CAMPEP_0198149558 /NCGR_PEP_ID=MMETSP1443-20131203/47197_1 /TAXON_ID=186043 /ORGANISM="Entomoneis sp., Strain CCMP2396" /LENGTH=334 /DNA_ID=CAMNT_0043814639 /DNA_START=35 /DNA_END=1039 /DNA_ORIENTATION=+
MSERIEELASNSNYMLSRDSGDGIVPSNSKESQNEEQPTSSLLPSAFYEKSSLLPSDIHAKCGAVVNSQVFQQLMLLLIVLNSLLTAVGTFDFVIENDNVQWAFTVADTLLLSIFSVELLLHLAYFGSSFFSDGWLVFDFIVVMSSWIFQATSVLRSFRIIRAIRLISKMKDMKDLVTALLTVMPRMGAISALLLLIYFVFTVLLTQLFKDAYVDGVTSEDHFSRLGLTAFTLIQFMFLDDWSSITRELMVVYPLAWIPILTFIIICTFIVVNLIIAVICDAVGALQTDEMSSYIEKMKVETADSIRRAERNHQKDMKRLEGKIDRLLKVLEEK